jgi:hypothetical protein
LALPLALGDPSNLLAVPTPGGRVVVGGVVGEPFYLAPFGWEQGDGALVVAAGGEENLLAIGAEVGLPGWGLCGVSKAVQGAVRLPEVERACPFTVTGEEEREGLGGGSWRGRRWTVDGRRWSSWRWFDMGSE